VGYELRKQSHFSNKTSHLKSCLDSRGAIEITTAYNLGCLSLC